MDPEENDDDGDLGDVHGAFYDLDSGMPAHGRIRIRDSDGEHCYFRVGDLVMLRAPLSVLDPAERLEEEDADDAEASAAQPAAAK